jgi:hypothetical protein
MLADMPATGGDVESAGAPLIEPVVAEWVVGSLGVSYDEDADRVVIVAEELVEEGGRRPGPASAPPGTRSPPYRSRGRRRWPPVGLPARCVASPSTPKATRASA